MNLGERISRPQMPTFAEEGTRRGKEERHRNGRRPRLRASLRKSQNVSDKGAPVGALGLVFTYRLPPATCLGRAQVLRCLGFELRNVLHCLAHIKEPE